jgi:predicted metal-dependent RNase
LTAVSSRVVNKKAQRTGAPRSHWPSTAAHFAIGRTQLLLYLLAGAFKKKTLPPFPIYLDSPMAIEATTFIEQITTVPTLVEQNQLFAETVQVGLVVY